MAVPLAWCCCWPSCGWLLNMDHSSSRNPSSIISSSPTHMTGAHAHAAGDAVRRAADTHSLCYDGSLHARVEHLLPSPLPSPLPVHWPWPCPLLPSPPSSLLKGPLKAHASTHMGQSKPARASLVEHMLVAAHGDPTYRRRNPPSVTGTGHASSTLPQHRSPFAYLCTQRCSDSSHTRLPGVQVPRLASCLPLHHATSLQCNMMQRFFLNDNQAPLQKYTVRLHLLLLLLLCSLHLSLLYLASISYTAPESVRPRLVMLPWSPCDHAPIWSCTIPEFMWPRLMMLPRSMESVGPSVAEGRGACGFRFAAPLALPAGWVWAGERKGGCACQAPPFLWRGRQHIKWGHYMPECPSQAQLQWSTERGAGQGRARCLSPWACPLRPSVPGMLKWARACA